MMKGTKAADKKIEREKMFEQATGGQMNKYRQSYSYHEICVHEYKHGKTHSRIFIVKELLQMTF